MAASNSQLKYKVIYQYIIEKIESGVYKEGEKLPSEDELCLYFSVSRITVRRAMKELETAGYIVKKHSKGAFVRQGAITMTQDVMLGFSEEMRRKNRVPSSKLLSIGQKNAGPEVALKLGIPENGQIYYIERLRLADGKPMAIEKLNVPCYLLPDINGFDLTKSFYDLVKNEYHLTIQDAEQKISADIARKRDAGILTISVGAPILRLERVTYLDNHVPLEFVTSVYRGDTYEFCCKIHRNP